MKKGEAVWPNKRMLSFFDFHAMSVKINEPAYNQYSLKHKNLLVHPVIHLKVHNNGIVQRDLLEYAHWESMLTWRIYQYNSLVKSDSATNKELLEITKTGNYIVMIGINGPNGFMPVSNVINFPLFPTQNGSLQCIPLDTDSDRIPNCLEEIYEIRKKKSNLLTKNDKHLLSLWHAWRNKIFEQSIDGLPILPPHS